MPTNLPPDYFEVEKRFRESSSPVEKVALLEEMLSIVPKHKGTDHLRAELRRKLAKLKEEGQTRKKGGGGHSSFYVEKEGAGQAVILGLPNVGKSLLVRAVTNAKPEVSDAPFTTWKVTPGMMQVENIQVQLVDTPPLSAEHIEPALMDVVRKTDLLLIMVDLQTDPIKQLAETVEMLEKFHIAPEQMQKHHAGERVWAFLPTLVLVNKCDDIEMEELYQVFCELMEEPWSCIQISARTGYNVAEFKRTVYEKLGIIRVYAKPPGKEPDYKKPFVLKKGETVAEFARQIHNDFYEKLASARVWGSSQFEGQMVQRDYVLQEGDVVELKT